MGVVVSDMGIVSVLKRVDNAVSLVTESVCVISLAAIVIMFLLNVFVRFVPVYNFTQTDDSDSDLFGLDDFFGNLGLVRTRNHFVVEVLTERRKA